MAVPATARWGPVAYTVFRIGIGLLFMQHGAQKVFGLFGGQVVPLGSRLGVAGVIELVAGTLIVIGLFTRPAAALGLLEMLAALVLVHLPRGGAPIENGGELALLYVVSFILLAANGAGPYSADAQLTRTRARVATE